MTQNATSGRTMRDSSTLLQGADMYAFGTVNHHEGVFLDLELKETALAAYEQAIQLAPREAILHYHKSHVLDQMGRLTEAQRAYEEACRLGYQK